MTQRPSPGWSARTRTTLGFVMVIPSGFTRYHPAPRDPPLPPNPFRIHPSPPRPVRPTSIPESNGITPHHPVPSVPPSSPNPLRIRPTPPGPLRPAIVPESQRDSATMPRAARSNGPPWVYVPKQIHQPCRGCLNAAHDPVPSPYPTPLALIPRDATSPQGSPRGRGRPWALLW